jgi:PD-(D/E)XK nuclease superfamily
VPRKPSELPYLRNSERALFKRCQQAWWWNYREGLRNNQFKADALWFGTGVHLALAEFYRPGFTRGPAPADTWLDYCGETIGFMNNQDVDSPEFVDARALGVAMLTGYVQRWQADDPAWEIIQPEYPFSVLIGAPKPVVNLVGTFDGVLRDHRDGKIKLMEHKTAASISTRHLVLDDQAGTYWAVATHALRQEGKIGPRESLYGIEYNFLRKGMPDERPRDAEGFCTNQPTKEHYIAALDGTRFWTTATLRKFSKDELVGIAADNKITVLGDRSKTQPPPLFLRTTIRRTAKERAIQLQRIQDEVEHMTAVRSGALPITKTPTKECSFCQFVEMCELHESGGDWEALRDFGYHREDPYADHRPGVDITSKFVRARMR